MKRDDLIMLALLGVGAYIVWRYFQQAVQTVTAPATTAIANTWVYLSSAWNNMTLFPSMSVLGNAVMPDGSLVPMSSFTLKGDSTGALYGNYAGHYYQFTPSDSNGNFPATLIN